MGVKPVNKIDLKIPKPKIVMDHNPMGIGEGIEQNADLVLRGHIHKGQFFSATLFTKLAYGARGFYGHTTTGHTRSIVSAGAGHFQLSMRIGTNSELVAIHVEFHDEEDQVDSNFKIKKFFEWIRSGQSYYR